MAQDLAKPNLPVRMAAPQLERLAEVAAERGVTRSELVREALARFLAEHEEQTKRAPV